MDPDSERLVLPSLILPGRHLRIVDYWHHQISSTPLPRIGLDWHRRLHPASSALLDRLQLIHGRDGMVVAVQICRENTDIDEVLRAFDRFRFVVIYTDLPCRNVHLGGLNSLCWRLRKVLAKLFPRRCEELNLPNRWEVLDPLLRDLADPEEIVALANGFLEVQLGGLREEGWVNALKRQVIVRQMLTRKPDEFVQLLAYACRRPKEDRLRLCGESDPEHQVRREEALAQELAEKDLLLDTNLRGWAAWLAEEPVTAGLFRRKGSLPGEHQRLAKWEPALEEAAGWMEDRTLDLQADWADPDLEAVWMLLVEGQLQQAQEELEALEWRLEVDDTTDLWRTDYFFCVGELHRRLKNLDLANRAFEQALLYGEGAPPRWRAATLYQFATALVDQGRHSEATVHLWSALRLDSPEPQKITMMLDLAQIMVKAGQDSEAEKVLSELCHRDDLMTTAPGIFFQAVEAYASFLFQRGRFAQAEIWYQALTVEAQRNRELTTNPDMVLLSLAFCLFAQRKIPEAIGTYAQLLGREATINSKTRIVALNGLAACYLYQHHEEPAIASLRQAVNAITFDVPPQIRVSTRLSFALFSIKKKSWHEVKAILQPALEDITHPEVTTSMGAKVRLVYADALRHLNQHDEAAEHLQAAAEITSDPPSDPGLRRKVLESLAEVYEKLGRHAEKKKLRREAAALPGGPATDPPMLLDLNLSRPSPASTLRL